MGVVHSKLQTTKTFYFVFVYKYIHRINHHLNHLMSTQMKCFVIADLTLVPMKMITFSFQLDLIKKLCDAYNTLFLFIAKNFWITFIEKKFSYIKHTLRQSYRNGKKIIVNAFVEKSCEFYFKRFFEKQNKSSTKVQINSVGVKRCQRVRAILWTVSFFLEYTLSQQSTDILTQRNSNTSKSLYSLVRHYLQK